MTSTNAKKQTAPAAKPGVKEVIDRLIAGNRRFREGNANGEHTGQQRRQLAAQSNQGHYALATVLACSDSRAPVELIFDAGIMELFVVRVAGNVIDQSSLASVEYGVLHAHTPLLMVLGHTDCGAVTATVKSLEDDHHPPEENVRQLLSGIRPAAAAAMEKIPHAPTHEKVLLAVEENVRKSLNDIFEKSEPLRRARDAGSCLAKGAIYDLESGEVSWL